MFRDRSREKDWARRFRYSETEVIGEEINHLTDDFRNRVLVALHK